MKGRKYLLHVLQRFATFHE